MQALNVRRHAKPSTAYAEAMAAIGEELEAIKAIGKDCRTATWIEAEEMTRLAMALQNLRKHYAE